MTNSMPGNERPPSPLGYALMGLLSQGQKSGYELRKCFAETPLAKYSSSPGSVYPAIRRLVEGGLIVKTPRPGAVATTKSVFRLTGAGVKSLRAWLRAEGLSSDELVAAMDIIPLRFGFMEGVLPKHECLAYMSVVHEGLTNKIAELEAYVENHETDLGYHGRLAMELGIAVYRTWIDWAAGVIKSLGGDLGVAKNR